MSAHDPQMTLRQMQDAIRRLQTICADKTMEQFCWLTGWKRGRNTRHLTLPLSPFEAEREKPARRAVFPVGAGTKGERREFKRRKVFCL
jgi:hypothetical protein